MIGFEQSVYVVFEGESIDVCVAVLDRFLSTDDERHFMVDSAELTLDSASGRQRLILQWNL